MKSKFIRIVNLIVAAAVFVFAIGYVFAWLAESRKQAEQKFNGSSGQAYFAGGDGSAGDPFIINDKYHLYNLAWLQNTGKLTDRYYFALGSNVAIDDDNFWLPPIGTDTEPFVGDFNGNGHTISGLKITTDTSKLRGVPNSFKNGSTTDHKFSNAVGLFGMTQKKEGKSDGAVIHNFILDKPIVEVATQNAPYSTTMYDNKDMAAGLAIGFLNTDCKASSIGILSPEGSDGAQLLMNRANGYSTFNSIIGALGNNATSSVTGGGHGNGGSGNAFGANFDVDGMYARLTKIEANKKSSTPAWRLPSLGSSSHDSITLGSLEKLPFTVTDGSTYGDAYAMELVANNNIGYLLGNQNKVYRKTVNFGDLLIEQNDADKNWTYADGTNPSDGKIPRWIYTISSVDTSSDSYNSIRGFAALTPGEFEALPDGIKKLVPETKGNVEGFTSIRMSQTYQNVGGQIYPGTTSNGQWSPHGQISWNGKVYGEGFRGTTTTAPENNKIQDAVNINGVRFTADGNYLDDNGFVYTADGYFLPNEEFENIIYSVDEMGHGKDKNGKYYFKYKKVWNDTNYIIGLLDENGYFYNDDGFVISNFSKPVFVIDSEGYAMYSNDIYYDASGNIIDGNGYVKGTDGEGYFFDYSNMWPFNGMSIDSEGYFLDNGERYKDEDGKEICAYGYGIASDVDGNYYLVKDGVKATFKQYGNTKELPPKKGTRVKALKGEEMITSMSGSYVSAKAGTTVAYHRFTQGIALPNCGIWFKPIMAGKIRLVMYAEKAGDGFALIKGQRTKATKENPFYIDYSTGGAGLSSQEIGKFTLPSNVLFYFEFDVSEEDIADGRYEYWLMQYGAGGAYFVYMDLGASAAKDHSTVDPNVNVSAVDFIYEGVEIAKEEKTIDGAKVSVGDFILSTSGTPYTATQTSIYFENLNKILSIVYVRPENGKNSSDNTLIVTVTPTADKGEIKQTQKTAVIQ